MKPVWFFVAAVVLAALWRRRKHLEPTLLAGGVLVAIGCVIYATGLVHVPKIDTVLKNIGNALGPWTYLLVAVMAFLETGAFVGLIAPGETVILIGGVVAGQGQIDIIALIAIVWTAAVCGDMASFFLGRRLGRDFLVRHGPRFGINAGRLETVEGFFDKHGGKAIFLGRFVGLVRAIAPFLAGSSGMALRRFAPYDIVGAGLWGTTFALLGFFFWHSIDKVLSIAKKGSLALATLIVLGVLIVNAVRWLREDANQDRLRVWMDEQGERPLLRPVVALMRRGIVLARFTYNRLTPGDLGLELTTLVATLSVGSFVFIGYAITLSGDDHTPGDRRGLHWANDIATDWLISLSKVITNLGTLPVVGTAVVITALVLNHHRERLAAIGLVAGMVLTHLGVHFMKALEDRPRPPDPLVHAGGSSYPSGHAANAMGWIAIAVALRLIVPSLRARSALLIAGIVMAVAVGLTRIQLRVHWFSDVAGGWGLGATAFSLVGIIVVVARFMRQTSPSEQ